MADYFLVLTINQKKQQMAFQDDAQYCGVDRLILPSNTQQRYKMHH